MWHNAYMILKPVGPDRALPLNDAAAKSPKGLSNGDELKRMLAHEQERLGELQSAFYADRRHALLVVLQGRDASGKDGAIRSVFTACNPQGCQVQSFKAPTELELSHDFLWRVHQVIPPKGMIGIFNRSHYEDVLVVRVKNLAPKEVWSPRYDQINGFEKYLTENNVHLLKFFLHISKEEQAERLQSRLENPHKQWKFETADLAMRADWKEFMEAYEIALNECSTPWAPWHIIPANRKWYRDYVIAQVIVEAMEKLKLKWPKPKEDLSKIKIV